jgi:hypothetical protein
LFQGLSEGRLEEAAQKDLQASQRRTWDMQVRHDDHTSLAINLKEQFERSARSIDEDEDAKNFFQLFLEGSTQTLEESLPALLYMNQIADRQPRQNHKLLLIHSLHVLIRSDSKMLSWPTSPLIVLLEFVDPNVLSEGDDAPLEEGESNETALHHLADLADPFDYSTHENQVILANNSLATGPTSTLYLSHMAQHLYSRHAIRAA